MRTRTRRVLEEETVIPTEAVETVAKVTNEAISEIGNLLADQFRANKTANAYTRTAGALKKELHKRMIAAGLTEVVEHVEVNGETLMVRAAIEAPEEEVISVEKLRALVDDATFMKIVKATKTAVTAEAGTNVAIASTVTQQTKEDLRIKEVRA